MTLLYWLTRLVRVACEFGSATAAAAVAPANAAAVPPMVPMFADAASLEVVMVILPVVSIEACRLFADRAALSWFRVET